MARPRKTHDEWHIFVDYGYGDGWEHETTELSARDARVQLKTYRKEQQYPVKMKKRRVRNEVDDA